MSKSLWIPVIFIAVLLTVEPLSMKAQDAPTDTSTVIAQDTLSFLQRKDSTKAYKSPIEDIITYPAQDSTIYDIRSQRVEMYKGARVDYQNISLEADYILYDFRTMEVLAHGVEDSSGTVIGKPVFTEGSNSFRCDTIRYDFKTGKGLISGVITNDGESYVHSELSKKQANGEVHNKGGKYTTCNLDKPHYHFRFNKMIVIPNDKIVTGPIYMKVGSVPTPLGLPFGYFPNTTKQKAGILIPGYGNSGNLGYFLINGGYYLPISDYMDTKITGDIYSRGSWGLRNITRYTKRYAYSGNIDLNYNNRLFGDPDLLGFSKESSFFIRWNHSQDGKARPGTTFSANINAGTSNSFTNNYNSSLNDFISNTFASGVNYSKRWRTSQLTMSARHSQNTSSRNVNFTLPQVSYNLNRFFLPLSFLRGSSAGPKKAYETIGVTYNSTFENRLNTREQDLRFDNVRPLSRDIVNGVNHNISANTSVKLGYFALNPNFRLTERWHFAKTERSFSDGEIVTDTLRGFYATRDYSMSANLTTKIYGMYGFRNSRIKAIRHVMTPSIGLSYSPEFDFNEEITLDEETEVYNPFSVSAYSQNNTRERGAMNFSLQNNLEMKVRTRSDSAKVKDKKVALIENLTVNTGYNFIADSLKLDDIRVSARTTLFKKTQVQYSGVFDPYQVNNLGQRVDDYRITGKGPILRGKSHNVALSTQLSGGTGKSRPAQPTPDTFASDQEIEEVRNNPQNFVDFTIPWNLRLSYTVNVSKVFNTLPDGGLLDTTIVSQHGVLFNGDLRLFKKWMLGFSSGYDLKNEEWGSTVLTLNWDLHCWAFTATVIPFGDRKSYNLSLGVNASILQDLKLQRRGVLGNGQGLLF